MGGTIRIENCPKNINHCPEANCPSYPCWAYEQHLGEQDKAKRERDSGWE